MSTLVSSACLRSKSLPGLRVPGGSPLRARLLRWQTGHHRGIDRGGPWRASQRAGNLRFGAVINVHFSGMHLLEWWAAALLPGGFLCVETVENRGENYRELPLATSIACDCPKV